MSIEQGPIYLGDAVYAQIENGMVRLSLDYGMGPQNEIYLEPEVFDSLLAFLKRVGFLK